MEDVRAHPDYHFSWDKPDRDNRHLTGQAWWRDMESVFATMYRQFGAGRETADALSKQVRAHLLDVRNYTVYDDAVETLERCRDKGYKNILVSNNYPELPEMLERLGLDGCFDGAVVSGLLGYDKPRREFFEAALAIAGNPEICTIVGDNPVADIEGGRAMGWQTVLVHRDRPSRADYVFDTLREIPDILV